LPFFVSKNFRLFTLADHGNRMDNACLRGNMSARAPGDVTGLLLDWNAGNRAALDALLPLLYRELRQLARHYMLAEKPGQTLQPTALVHEAYLRLVDQRRVNWQNRAQFFGVASQIIRRLLVDRARARHRLKRGGDVVKMTWNDNLDVPKEDLELEALDEALKRLADLDPQQSRIIELRFFGGLSIEETAEALNISPATVKRDWAMARAWLFREITAT
jgi:RNA polymerase sigma factor (TIGR02999 family)